jgi:hypothetical protein
VGEPAAPPVVRRPAFDEGAEPMSDTIADHIRSLYGCLGDRAGFDAHLDRAVTIWESDADRLLVGLADLDALRDGRQPAADRTPPTVVPEQLRTDDWGDTGLARYLLRASHPDPDRPDECFRVSDVLRRSGGRWVIVHHHAEATTHQR